MNDRAYIAPGSGFIRANIAANVYALPFGFAEPPERWSALGIAAYANLREQSEALISAAIDAGFVGVCLDEGVAILVRAGGERPQWSVLDDAAVDLLTAQAVRLAAEAR